MKIKNKEDKQTGVEVRVTGLDGNVFAIMGRISRAMKKAGFVNEAKQMCKEVQHTKSYGEALITFGKYVELY